MKGGAVMDLGQRLRQLRKEKGLTQKEFANLLGVSASMVGQYETNLRKPKIETLKRFAEALDVPLNRLFSNHPYEFYSDEIYEIFDRIVNSGDLTEDDLQKLRNIDNLSTEYLSELGDDFLVSEINKLIAPPLQDDGTLAADVKYYIALLINRLNLEGKLLAMSSVRDIYLNPNYRAK